MSHSSEKYIALTKKEIQLIKSLKSTHGRKKNRAFVVEAIKNVNELLNSKTEISTIYVSEKMSQKQQDKFKVQCWQRNISFRSLQEFDFDKITTMTNPEGILAICQYPETLKTDLTKIEFPAIYLSEANDPGNLGTIFRTAAWYGIKSILISENSVDAYNPKVLRSSMGSFFHLQIIQNVDEIDFLQFAEDNNIALYAAELRGKNPVKFVPQEKYILCFGSESHGVPPKILDNSNAILSIPKFGSGESLNLAMSVGILLNSLINKG